jgi:hypothetical protein
MGDFTATKAQAKGAAPCASRVVGQTEAVVAKTPRASPPPTANRVDRMYRQLAVINTIAVVQLAKCAYWRRSSPTSSPVWVGTGQ